MKLALLVALATVAAVSSYNPTVNSVVFKPGEEYVYHYKGQVLSGIPKSSKMFAGLLIDSLVVLQFQQDYRVVMKLEKIKLFKINDKISTLPSELLPESELTRLTGEQATVISEHLIKPLKFRYEEGEVRELEKETTDRFWSVNIKKGILSLFQVTLKEKNSFSSSSSDSSLYSDPTMSRIKSYGSRSPVMPYWKQTGKTNSVYKVMESDVTGNCETKYTVISNKEETSERSSKMHVTRVRNFDNCINKPFYIQGLFQGVYSSPTEKDLIQPIVHTEYVITGDRSHFLIKEATLRGKYFVFINGLEGGDMSSYIFQHLTLKTTEPIRTPVRLMTPKMDVHGLLMVIPQSTLLPEKKMYEDLMTERSSVYGQRRMHEYPMKKEYLKELEDEEEEGSILRETGDIVSVVEEKLTELVQCLYGNEDTDKKCSQILMHISRIMREADKEQLMSIYNRYVRGEQSTSSETEYRKAEILLDILPTLPKPEAAKVLLELIREQKISELRGSILIKAMSLLVKPTPMVIKSIMELFKELPKERSTTLSSKTLLRQALLLSVGTVTHRLIMVMRSHGKPIPEVITFIDGITMEMKRMLEEQTSESEKVLILKSLGNMGASETIMTLKNIIEDRRQPQLIRVNAIIALRRVAKHFSKQVIPIVLGVFMDVKENNELRSVALLIINSANPSFTTLQMIAHSLRHEPSSQIRTLVYSSLINLASHTSHEPEHKILAKNARLIIKTIPPVHVGVHDTMNLFVNKFSEKFDLGGEFNLLKCKSKTSGLNEALVGSLQGTLFGKHRRILDIGVEGKSLDVILRKVFGPYGLLREILKGDVSLNDFIKPLTRIDMGGIEHKIREILNKMMIEPTSEETPLISWFGRLLGNELQYIVLNSQNVEEVVNKATIIIPELLMKLTRGVKVDIVKSLSHVASVTIATPLGVPLSLNFTTMGVMKVDGHVKINNLPSWSEVINRRFLMPVPKISLEVDLKPLVDVTQYVALGVNMRWLGAGVGAEAHIHAKSPVKLTVHVDGPEHTVSIKYFTPKETLKTLFAEFVPTTYIMYVPTTVSKLPFLLEKKEIKNEEIVKISPFEYRYQCSLTGLELQTRGVFSLCGPTWCPIMPFFGKQEISIYTRPISNVDYVHLKIKSLKTNFQFEGVPASQLTENLYEESEDETEEESYREPINRNYRTASRMMIESGEFEPITTDPIFKSEPIKRQLLITLGPNNIQSPKVKTLITWLMSRGYWENQLNVQVIRLAHGETPAWKVVLNNVVNPLTWYPEELQYRGESGEFLVKTDLIYDIYGQQQKLKLKVIPGSPFDFTRELKEHSILTTDNMPAANAQKYKYTVEMEFPQMTHKMLKYITIMHDFIKYQAYHKLTTAIPQSPRPNKVIVSVELLPWWEQMNIIVKTPREDSYISAVPFYWNPFLPTNEKIRMHDMPAWKWYENKSENSQYFRDTVPYTTSPVVGDKCFYSQQTKKIETFDGVSLPVFAFEQYLKKSCEFVMTQHCSNDGLFSVIASGDSQNWKLKILVPKHEIKLVSREDRHVTVFVNGEEKPVHVSQPLIIGEEYTESSPMLYKIEKLDTMITKVVAKELGVTIVLDSEAKTVMIKVSPFSMLQGQLCGLCGNYNQDQSDDFYNTQSDFQVQNRDFFRVIKNSLIPSESCSYEHITPINDEVCLKESHLTVNRYENETPMTCTTEKKVPQCAEGCRPERMESIKTCFTCRSETGFTLPRKTYLPPRWEQEESGVQCEDFFQRVEVPTRCVPVY